MLLGKLDQWLTENSSKISENNRNQNFNLQKKYFRSVLKFSIYIFILLICLPKSTPSVKNDSNDRNPIISPNAQLRFHSLMPESFKNYSYLFQMCSKEYLKYNFNWKVKCKNFTPPTRSFQLPLISKVKKKFRISNSSFSQSSIESTILFYISS